MKLMYLVASILVLFGIAATSCQAAYFLLWENSQTGIHFTSIDNLGPFPEPIGDIDGDGQVELVGILNEGQPQSYSHVKIYDAATGVVEGDVQLQIDGGGQLRVILKDLNLDTNPEVIVYNPGYPYLAVVSSTAPTSPVEDTPSTIPPANATIRPNPFNPTATIDYSIPHQGSASLQVHDAAGRLVRTLVDGKVEPGKQSISWDGRDHSGQVLPSGTYFYELRLDGKSLDKGKAVILK